MVEVAPAELPHEGLAARCLARALRHLERRDAAEVKVGRQTRCALDREVVAPALVLPEAVAHPACEPRPALRLAAQGKVRGGVPTGERPGSGKRRVVPRRARRDRRGRGQHRAPGRHVPPLPVGREDPVGSACLARRDVSRRDDRDPRERLDRDPVLRRRSAQPMLSLLGERAHVLAQVDASRPGLHGETDRLRDGVTAANDEVTTPLDQRVPQVGQRVEEERDPIRRTEAGEDTVVEDEERHDLGRAGHRRMEGGVVVHAEVACEEDDGRAHPSAPAGVPRCTRRGWHGRPRRPATTARASGGRWPRGDARCARSARATRRSRGWTAPPRRDAAPPSRAG